VGLVTGNNVNGANNADSLVTSRTSGTVAKGTAVAFNGNINAFTFARISCVIVASSTGGTAKFQWAQNVAVAVNSKVLAGSVMRAHRYS
jgi:hypothetical protein